MKYDNTLFDVIVLGERLGGLIAATRLAQERCRILLLKERKFLSSYSREGYRFVPFSTLSEKQIPTALLKKIPMAAGLVDHRRKKEKYPPKVFFQVILPESRIDLYQERSLLRREWEREFPDEKDRIEAFYSQLEEVRGALEKIRNKRFPFLPFPSMSPLSFKRWMSWDNFPKGGTKQWLSSFSPEFKKFIELQMLSYGSLCSASYPIPLVAYCLMNGERSDPISFDLENVEHNLIETFQQHGGVVKEIDGIEKVEIKWRKVVGLLLTGEETGYRSRLLLLNAPLHPLSKIFRDKRSLISRWEKKMKPRYTLIPFFLGVREKVVPIGMGNLLVSILDDKRSYEEGNLLFLSLSQRGDESQAPEGKRAVTVQALMPYKKTDDQSFSKLQDGVMIHLKHLFPFLEDYVEFVDGQWAEHQMACWSYPYYFYEMESEFKWGEEILPTRILKNVYVCGREIYPYLGLEGEILSGLQLGFEILKRCR